ncbi:MAG TPA: DUF1800 domain-containing protein [Vicinamibacteria bacterium]|nr:DUF1800 domain-containing protein [Vicinamibacteria bacterium]
MTPPPVGPRVARFALDRLGYGPRPDSIDEVLGRGLERWIEDQLAPAPDGSLDTRLRPLSSLSYSIAETLARYDADQRTIGLALQELRSAHFIRAVHSRNQLEEVLTDFWFNHFNVYEGDSPTRYGLARYEMDVIRPHVLGKFRDLLGAVANSWAMMSYLDNYLSSARAINENYARELMELHTLGVDGGYTQADVQEVARAFTGWGIDQRAGAFTFRAGNHDQGAKTILGQRLPANQGKKDGEDVLDLLARHPSTARFISTKLCRRFVSDAPSEAVVARGADAFTSSSGNLAEVMRAIIGTADFWNEAFGAGKIKTPHEFVVSALRAIGAEVTSARAFVEGRVSSLTSMGMPTYEALDPTGWSDRGTDWLPNPGSHLARMNFVLSLVSQTTEGVAVDLRTLIGGVDPGNAAAVTAAVDQRVFGGTLPEDVARACRSVGGTGSLPAGFKVVGLALASPAFQAR